MRVRCSFSAAANANYMHAKGARQRGEPAADASEADDDDGLAIELVLAGVAVGDHAAPMMSSLIVASGVELPGEGEDQRHGVLSHGALVGALGAGEADATRGK